uniref:alpha-N-acetylneuraminyl-2,3-beta-galactosyl-1,3-N-acetylgalactosaminide6-alpha-sialyltransferase n=1 Tax=Apteryx owenii TaxID=8824 RepID=A0A8B9PSJ4_APTOW
MRTLVRLFLALVSLATLSVLYVLLCSHGCLGMRCQPAGEPGSPSYAAPRALCFHGYSRVPDGKPLVRAPCRRCALVSSSGQMLGSRLGKAIDGEECVLRMNHAPTRGYEEDVGVRSTIRVVSHTSVPLLLRNQPYFFKQSQETVYIIWGPTKKMSREKAGPTYRALLKVMEKYPSLQIYTLTEQKMAYCDDVFQNETGKNRMKSGSFLSTGWFTMILAMELCEQILVFGMVNDNYCREKNHSSVPYHYFEKGRLDECKTYLAHERAPRAGHRFITEKAVFSRWAKKRNIVFTHPSWAGG